MRSHHAAEILRRFAVSTGLLFASTRCGADSSNAVGATSQAGNASSGSASNFGKGGTSPSSSGGAATSGTLGGVGTNSAGGQASLVGGAGAAGGQHSGGANDPAFGSGGAGYGGSSFGGSGSGKAGESGRATTSGGAAGRTATGANSGGGAIGGAPRGGSSNGGSQSGGVSSGGRPAGGTSSTTAAGRTSVAGSGGCLDGPGLVVPAGYELVWQDEFGVDGAPDPSNWGYESGFVRNEEAQWYQPDNARVEKGCLVIEARRERKANPNYQAGSSDWKTNRQYAEYTSSSLRTLGKRTWQYGRFEMRGRIKTQAGLWPAWWTLGVGKEWPSCGEIDIMEYYAGMVRANVACGTSQRWVAKWDGAAWNTATFEDKNWQNVFHVWRMDWNEDKIELLLDDKLVNTTNLSDMLNPDGSSPFRQAHYMIVNLAIGGNNGGDPSNTPFPSRYEIDYVRVFQKQ